MTEGSGRASRLTNRASLLALVVLALALRLYHLDAVDLRGDEAFDVLYAAQPLSEVIRNDLCCQAYPPVHHAALHYWMGIAGDSEFSYRFLFGVLPGVLTVLLVYRLAGELFPQPAPSLAALLAAASPFLVWWAQDGHFYSAMAGISAAILWLGLRAQRRGGSWRSLVPYGVACVTGLYYHYFTAFAVLGVLLVAAARGLSERRWAPWLRRLLAVHLAVAAAVAPWALLALGMMQDFELGWAPAVSLPAMLARLFHAYSLGYTAAGGIAAMALLAGFALALAAGLAWRREGGRRGTAALPLVGPLLVFWLVSLLRPMFDEKFTVFALPVYLAVLGGGLAWPRPRTVVRLGLAALLLAGCGASLVRYYHDASTYKSPDWSAAVAAVAVQGLPDDLLVYDFPDPAVLYYAGSAAVESRLVPSTDLSGDEAAAEMESLAAEHDRVWLVPLADPEWPGGAAVEQWLQRHCLLEDEQAFRGLTLRLYRTPQAVAHRWLPLDAEFQGVGRLAGYWVDRPADGGAALRLVLRWEPLAPSEEAYTVFVHLVGADGTMLAQRDNPPVGGSYATTEWRSGEAVVDTYAIEVPAGVDLEGARLRVGLYRPDTMARVPVSGGDAGTDYVELDPAEG